MNDKSRSIRYITFDTISNITVPSARCVDINFDVTSNPNYGVPGTLLVLPAERACESRS